MQAADDLGACVDIPPSVNRVVSLVPSLTESVAVTAPEVLVGATTWCTHPAGLVVERIRGTKNPDLSAVLRLQPDVVLANKEENRELDVRRLREAGVAVWVTDIRMVDGAFASLRRLFIEALRRDVPTWLTAAQDVWATPPSISPRRVAVPIWRDPWMVIGPDTFANDVLTRLGLDNVFAGAECDPCDRYPHTHAEGIVRAGPDVVLLPDEPYEFSGDDGPEAFPDRPSVLVSGRALTWYGPSMASARDELVAALESRADPCRGTALSRPPPR